MKTKREKALEMIRKAEAMRANAFCNLATNSRNSKVGRMMIGRADALESRAYRLLDEAEKEG